MKTKTAFLLLTTLVLASCATFRHREGVDVSLVRIQLGESTLLETTMNVTIRIANEAPEPFIVEGGVHKLYLNGLYVGEGLSNQILEIPRLESVTQAVTMHLQNLRLLTRIRGILESERVDYRIVTSMYVREYGRRSTFHTARDGTLDLREFQPSQPPAAPGLN